MSEQTIVVGTLTGSLADAARQSADGSSFLASGENKAPILMSGSQVARLTGEEKQAVKSTYEAGYPIVLLDVVSEEINGLHGILETGLSHGFAPGVVHAEAYGINREPGGVLAQGTFYDVEVEFKADLTVNHRNEDGTTVDSSIDGGFEAVLDTEESQQFRWASVRNWIADAGKRFDQAPKAAATETNQLTQLANAFIDTAFWFSQVVVPLGFPPSLKTLTNQYQVSSFCFSCFSQNNQSSWFYIQQQGVLNATNSYVFNSATGQGYYVDTYQLTAWPTDFLNQPALVSMVQSSPSSTTGTTQVTSSVNFSISGTVGFQGKQGVGQVTGGMEVSRSQTVDIPDVTVANLSNVNGNDAAWRFTMPLCHGIEDGCRNSIDPCKVVSRSTFQPFDQWLWRATPRTADFAVTTRFQLRLVLTTIGKCNIFGCNCDVNQTSQVPTLSDHIFRLPYPPKS